MKKVIVFGSFDPLHEGHRNFFSQAKRLGDYLTVVVARDKNIKLLKGHDPSQKESERMEAVKVLAGVDRVILGDSPQEYKVLDREKPDIIALGYDQKIPEDLKDRVKKYKIITLKPYKCEVFKSSLIKDKQRHYSAKGRVCI